MLAKVPERLATDRASVRNEPVQEKKNKPTFHSDNGQQEQTEDQHSQTRPFKLSSFSWRRVHEFDGTEERKKKSVRGRMDSEDSSAGNSRSSTPGEQREGFRLSRSRGRTGGSDDASRAAMTSSQHVAAMKLSAALVTNKAVLFEALRAALPVLKSTEASFSDVLLRLAESRGVVEFLSFVAAEEVASCTQETTLFRERGVFVELVSCLFKQSQASTPSSARVT
jgi:hypothetical protein